jgi:hypothetical protein
MLNSSRLKGGLDKPIIVWLKNFYTYFTFGGHGIIVILSLFFWVIFLYSILKSIRNKPELSDDFFTDGILILFAAALFYFPGLIVKKPDPSVIITPLFSGSRYFIVPYALSVFSLPVLIRQKKMVLILLLNFLFISGLLFPENMKAIRIRWNLNYQSYAWLSSRIENLIIPIDPQWEKFPGWHIRTLKPTTNNPYRKKINVKAIRKYGVSSFTEDKFLNLNNDSYFIIDIPYECTDSKHIGIEVDVNKENESWAEIFWTKKEEDYNNVRSHKRYYPAGIIRMQFAFKNKKYNELKFEPIEKSGALKINAFSFVCEN